MNKPADPANFFAPEVLTDPFDYYRAAFDEGVAMRHFPEMNTHVVFDYALCSEATGRPEDFSNDFGGLMGAEDDRCGDPERWLGQSGHAANR